MRIGDPADGYRLPPDIDIAIGTPSARGRLLINNNVEQPVSSPKQGAWLIASSGGDFTAYLTNLVIGTTGSGTAYYPNGVLDIAAMDSVLIDVDGAIQVPHPGTAGTAVRCTAAMLLPPGTVSATTLTVGSAFSHTDSNMRVVGNGTVFDIRESVVVDVRGVFSNNVNGVSCGLDLPAAATLTVAEGGKIVIAFKADPLLPALAYWGLRWEGDRVAELADLVTAGTLTLSNGPLADGPAEIRYDGTHTYIGLRPKRFGTVITFQ